MRWIPEQWDGLRRVSETRQVSTVDSSLEPGHVLTDGNGHLLKPPSRPDARRTAPRDDGRCGQATDERAGLPSASPVVGWMSRRWGSTFGTIRVGDLVWSGIAHCVGTQRALPFPLPFPLSLTGPYIVGCGTVKME